MAPGKLNVTVLTDVVGAWWLRALITCACLWLLSGAVMNGISAGLYILDWWVR